MGVPDLADDFRWFFPNYLPYAFLPGLAFLMGTMILAYVVPATLTWLLRRVVLLPEVSGGAIAKRSQLPFYGCDDERCRVVGCNGGSAASSGNHHQQHLHRSDDDNVMVSTGPVGKKGSISVPVPSERRSNGGYQYSAVAVDSDPETLTMAPLGRVTMLPPPFGGTPATTAGPKVRRSGDRLLRSGAANVLAVSASSLQSFKTATALSIAAAGIIVTFRIWELDITAPLTSSVVVGVLSILTSLVLRDVVQPYIDSLSVNFIGPVQPGDYVFAAGYEGWVIALEHVYFVLMATTGRFTLIPYSVLLNSPFQILNGAYEETPHPQQQQRSAETEGRAAANEPIGATLQDVRRMLALTARSRGGGGSGTVVYGGM